MRGDKCLTCGTYLDDLGYCPNADLHSLWLIQRARANWTPSGTCATLLSRFPPDQPTPRIESGAS